MIDAAAPTRPAVAHPCGDGRETMEAEITELVVGFADLAGSTALAARVSVRDYARTMAEFRCVAASTVPVSGGRLVKVVGDGALFLAADAATGAAVAFDLIAACARCPALPLLRGGLALGEVVLDGDDCFGLAVNLAAKSAALARPGSVLVTGAVAERLALEDRYLAARAADRGHAHLVHVPVAVELFELAPGGEPAGAALAP